MSMTSPSPLSRESVKICGNNSRCQISMTSTVPSSLENSVSQSARRVTVSHNQIDAAVISSLSTHPSTNSHSSSRIRTSSSDNKNKQKPKINNQMSSIAAMPSATPTGSTGSGGGGRSATHNHLHNNNTLKHNNGSSTATVASYNSHKSYNNSSCSHGKSFLTHYNSYLSSSSSGSTTGSAASSTTSVDNISGGNNSSNNTFGGQQSKRRQNTNWNNSSTNNKKRFNYNHHHQQQQQHNHSSHHSHQVVVQNQQHQQRVQSSINVIPLSSSSSSLSSSTLSICSSSNNSTPPTQVPAPSSSLSLTNASNGGSSSGGEKVSESNNQRSSTAESGTQLERDRQERRQDQSKLNQSTENASQFSVPPPPVPVGAGIAQKEIDSGIKPKTGEQSSGKCSTTTTTNNKKEGKGPSPKLLNGPVVMINSKTGEMQNNSEKVVDFAEQDPNHENNGNATPIARRSSKDVNDGADEEIPFRQLPSTSSPPPPLPTRMPDGAKRGNSSVGSTPPPTHYPNELLKIIRDNMNAKDNSNLWALINNIAGPLIIKNGAGMGNTNLSSGVEYSAADTLGGGGGMGMKESTLLQAMEHSFIQNHPGYELLANAIFSNGGLLPSYFSDPLLSTFAPQVVNMALNQNSGDIRTKMAGGGGSSGSGGGTTGGGGGAPAQGNNGGGGGGGGAGNLGAGSGYQSSQQQNFQRMPPSAAGGEGGGNDESGGQQGRPRSLYSPPALQQTPPPPFHQGGAVGGGGGAESSGSTTGSNSNQQHNPSQSMGSYNTIPFNPNCATTAATFIYNGHMYYPRPKNFWNFCIHCKKGQFCPVHSFNYNSSNSNAAAAAAAASASAMYANVHGNFIAMSNNYYVPDYYQHPHHHGQQHHNNHHRSWYHHNAGSFYGGQQHQSHHQQQGGYSHHNQNHSHHQGGGGGNGGGREHRDKRNQGRRQYNQNNNNKLNQNTSGVHSGGGSGNKTPPTATPPASREEPSTTAPNSSSEPGSCPTSPKVETTTPPLCNTSLSTSTATSGTEEGQSNNPVASSSQSSTTGTKSKSGEGTSTVTATTSASGNRKGNDRKGGGGKSGDGGSNSSNNSNSSSTNKPSTSGKKRWQQQQQRSYNDYDFYASSSRSMEGNYIQKYNYGLLQNMNLWNTEALYKKEQLLAGELGSHQLMSPTNQRFNAAAAAAVMAGTSGARVSPLLMTTMEAAGQGGNSGGGAGGFGDIAMGTTPPVTSQEDQSPESIYWSSLFPITGCSLEEGVQSVEESTPADKYLANAYLGEQVETPKQLLGAVVTGEEEEGLVIRDTLSQQIWNTFLTVQQSRETYRKKLVIWKVLYACIKKVFPRLSVYLVGSTITGFGAETSDVDMCVVSTTEPQQELEPRLEAMINLMDLKKFLSSSEAFESFHLIQAKVPILRFRDVANQIEVDLNYNNSVGIRNTHLLNCYSKMDWRVRPLVLVVKLWAKYQDINNAKNMTISSYSLALMVIHFLQCGVTPSVLPCLHTMFPGKFQCTGDVSEIDMDEDLEGYESQNKLTLSELMLRFLFYYSNFDYNNLAISVRTGTCLYIEDCRYVRSAKNDPLQWKNLCIEEPFEFTNTARSVYDIDVFYKIKYVFAQSYQELHQTLDLKSILNEKFAVFPVSHCGYMGAGGGGGGPHHKDGEMMESMEERDKDERRARSNSRRGGDL